MVISKIILDNFLYFDVHAEQAYTGSFLADTGDANNHICEGIYGTELTSETLRNIANEVANTKKMNVVLDFSRIKDVQSNLFNTMVEIKEYSELLILRNVSEYIIKKVNFTFYNKNHSENGIYDLFFFSIIIPNIAVESTDKVFYRHFSNLLVKSTLTNEGLERFKPNSPIYIPKFIDIKGMMILEPNFFLYILYRLAIQIRDKFSNLSGDQPTLFCQNLNGAYNAAILSRFLNYNLLSMDHIGPVNKVFTSIGNKIREEGNYIVVSDVVCLGTEIRICQNIIHYSGGRYIGNASIVKVETLNKEHSDSESVSVFRITKENNPINFQIKTALD